jgi:hypothetical protein
MLVPSLNPQILKKPGRSRHFDATRRHLAALKQRSHNRRNLTHCTLSGPTMYEILREISMNIRLKAAFKRGDLTFLDESLSPGSFDHAP